MATTELHVLVMHEIGTDATDTLIFTGWTLDAARQAFLDMQRDLANDDPDGVWTYNPWEDWIEGEGDPEMAIWTWWAEVHHLPA